MGARRGWWVLALACSACGQVEAPACGAALACGDVPRHVAPPAHEGCEGLDPDECLLPWPSSRFLVADATTGTGWRVQLPADAMPVNVEGVPVSTEAWDRWDGFSGSTTMMVQLDGPIDASTLPTWRDPGASLLPDSPTVVLDADTGERIAHFAELEPATEADPRVTLYIRPAARLPDDTHVVVAVRGLSGP
ncbi:MAG: hypothetical protein M3Y87_19690, partial [Myxococcota bacterium]|nr:hypothetical protein [Myxococcota bacterium]